MNIQIDEDRFDALQMRLLLEMVTSFKEVLEEAKIADDLLEDLTGKLAFSAAAIVDGSQLMDHEGEQIRPHLSFSTDDTHTEAISIEGASWMHEYVFGAIDEVFEEDED